MTKRYVCSSGTTAERMADRLDNRDEDVMQGLVTAGAFVALADRRASDRTHTPDHDEPVCQGLVSEALYFVPTFSE